MPRLLLFVPCERVIVGQGDASASLIIILHELQIHTGVAPQNLLQLHHFSVFSQWYKLPEDEGKTFEQRIALTLGSENPVVENVTTFKMTARMHRATVYIPRFPVLKSGEYSLTLSLREQSQAQWQAVGVYPINVTQVPQMQPQVQ